MLTPENATTFATLVGLLCSFAQSRAARTAENHQGFMEWLRQHQHDDIVEQITRTTGMQEEIERLLRQNHQELSAGIREACEGIAAILCRLQLFAGIARAALPNAEISEQAMLFLHHLVDSEHKELVWLEQFDSLIFESGEPASFECERFIGDDLESLRRLGFLSHKLGPGGDDIYRLTRAGERYFNSTQWKPSE